MFNQSLRAQHAQHVAAMGALIARSESRSLTDAEQREFDSHEMKARAIAAQANFSRSSEPDRRAQTFLGNSPEANGPFSSLGEQIRSVIDAGTPGRQADSRLLEVRAASGLNETTGADGGFLVQPGYSYSLLDAAMQASELVPRCRPFPIGQNSNGIELPSLDETSRANGSRFGGVRLFWEGEADQHTGTKPKFRKVSLKLKKLTGLCYLTDELIADTTVLDAFVRTSFSSEFSFTMDDAIFRGTGAGQPLGFLNSPALITVAKEQGQTARTVLFENITKMYSRMPASSLRNAVWLLNQDVLPQLLMMSLGVGAAGVPVYLPPGGASVAPYGTIFGRPIIFVEQASTLGTVGDISFVDLSRYLIADKGGLQTATSVHVRFLYDEQVLRFTCRLDGQPDLASPVTPYQGTATQSPFVVLESR